MKRDREREHDRLNNERRFRVRPGRLPTDHERRAGFGHGGRYFRAKPGFKIFPTSGARSRLTAIRFFPHSADVFLQIPSLDLSSSPLVLVGCVQQPLSSVDRTKYKTVALDPTIKVPDYYVYRDITGKRSRGMVGGVLGLLIGAASEGPGFKRFD